MRYNYVKGSRFIKCIVLVSLCIFSSAFAGVNLPAAGFNPVADRSSENFMLLSNAFPHGAPIPKQYTCDGDNLSPLLTWVNPPAETQSFALLLIDPDAKKLTGKEWIHWFIYDIPASISAVEVNTPYYVKGLNSFGRLNYGGPCPAKGTHHYYFVLYALDMPSLGQPKGISFETFIDTIQLHIIQQTVLMGTYQRDRE